MICRRIKAGIALFLHFWFYVLIGIATVLITPFLLLTLIRERDYPKFFWLARNIWANIILYGMGMWQKITYEQPLNKNKSYMLIANHSSMIDIMLMYRASKNPFVFVGKKELARLPLFGFFYKRVSILVDRGNSRSRCDAYISTNRYIKKGYSICIFPEGGIPKQHIILGDFKDGAFRLAIENNIPIIPMTFLDNKKRFPYALFEGGFGVMRAIVHRPIDTSQLIEEDKNQLKKHVRDTVLYTLEKYQPTKTISEKENISS